MKANVNIITKGDEMELVGMLREAEETYEKCVRLGFGERSLNYTRGCINAMQRMLDKLGIEYESNYRYL